MARALEPQAVLLRLVQVKPQAVLLRLVQVKPLERYQPMIVSNITLILIVCRMTTILQTSFRQL